MLTRLLITSKGAQIVVATVPCSIGIRAVSMTRQSGIVAACDDTHSQEGTCEVEGEAVLHQLLAQNHVLEDIVSAKQGQS